MNYSIEVDHDFKIIRYRHTGSIEKEDIGKVWEELLSNYEFIHLKYNLLSDYRNSTFNLNVNDVDPICDFLFSLRDILKGKKQSLMLDDPLSTAMSLLFEGEVNKKVGFRVKVFSTEESALEWLLK